MEQNEIQQVEVQRDNLIDLAERHQVQNENDADAANTILIKITAGLKEIEKKRKSFTAPLNQSLKQINETFRDIRAPIEAAKRNLSQRLMGWRTAERERIAAAQREAEEKARKEEERRRAIQQSHADRGHEVKEDITPVTAETPIPFEAKDTTKVRKQWDFEIINEQAVPDEFKMIDTGKIRKAIFANRDKEGRPTIKIPGVNIFQKEVPVYA